MTIKVDVFVSGAGPVGLFFAYQMAVRGHSVYICDPKPGPTSQSRAILVTSRTLEILEARGLAAEVLSEAFVGSGMRMFRNGQIIAHVDACGDSTPFPHLTVLPQGKTEKIILDRLESETEYKVHWNTELVSYTQDETKVISIVKNNDQEETIESKYIVGADGSHSKVRKENPEWTYEGATIQTKFALADLSIDGDIVDSIMDKMNTFLQGSRVIGMVRIPQGDSEHKNVFRIFGNLQGYERSEESSVTHGLRTKEAPPSLEFLQEWVDKITHPLKFQLSNVIWSSYFSINERIADEYRKKRAFIMGDAAHCHSPVGGQGMNLGLQDADNLAWKMSAVLKGTAKNPDQLLDSYNDERIPLAKDTIENTSGATQAGIMDNAVVNAIRATIISTVLMLPQIRHLSFKTLMQQYITIDPKNSKILGTSDKGLIKPGEFMPDTGALRKCYISNPQEKKSLARIQRCTLRELLIQNELYAVIFVGTCPSGVTPNTGLMMKFWKSTESYPVKRLVIQSAWHSHFMKEYPDYITDKEAAAEAFYSEESIDLPNSVTQRIGLHSILSSLFASSSSPSSVVLIVRPDMYIAQAKLVSNEAELEKSLEFLSSI